MRCIPLIPCTGRLSPGSSGRRALALRSKSWSWGWRVLVLAIGIGALGVVPAGAAAGPVRLIVGFSPETTPAQQRTALKSRQVRSQRTFDLGDAPAASVVMNADSPQQAIDAMSTRPGVEWVEVDHRARAYWSPGDPRIPDQWALARMGAATAWNSTRGDGATVAVIDTGVDYQHPDLAGRVDLGWDFVDNDDDPMDVQGHGTHVAGIAAASAGNAIGGSGLAPESRVLAVRALDADGAGFYSWIANAIVYSADQGAQVINLSLGGSAGSQALREAVGYAASRGAVVTCATGNDGAGRIGVPARYEGCTSIGATGSRDRVAAFSNRGSGIDLVAPGEAILSTVMGSGYEAWDGTSMATPFVSGLAALLMAEGHSARTALKVMRDTARDIGPSGWDRTSGFGRINAAAAMAEAARRGTPTSDAEAPRIASVEVGDISLIPTTVRRNVWKQVRSTSFTFIGYAPDLGAYNWRRIRTRGSTRTIYQYRARWGVVRRRTIVERRKTIVRTQRHAARIIRGLDVADNAQVDRIALDVNGRWYGSDWSSRGGWAVEWKCRPGTHTFAIRVYDHRNNSVSSSTRQTITC